MEFIFIQSSQLLSKNDILIIWNIFDEINNDL